MTTLQLYNISEFILHTIILVEFVIGIIMWLLWAKKHKYHKSYALSPILFMIHAGLYFTLTLLNVLNPLVGAIWTDFIAIHGITVIVSGAWAMIKLMPEDK